MNRKLLVAALFLVLALLVLTLSSMAAGRADPVAKASQRPSMSGDFATTYFAFTGVRSPSIFVPSDRWGTPTARDRHARLHGSAAA